MMKKNETKKKQKQKKKKKQKKTSSCRLLNLPRVVKGTVLSTFLRKAFFALRFILNENVDS